MPCRRGVGELTLGSGGLETLEVLGACTREAFIGHAEERLGEGRALGLRGGGGGGEGLRGSLGSTVNVEGAEVTLGEAVAPRGKAGNGEDFANV